MEWATQSCIVGFQTIGVWPETLDGTDLNTCARSNNAKYLATGDDFGKIKLYANPATQPKVRKDRRSFHSMMAVDMPVIVYIRLLVFI